MPIAISIRPAKNRAFRDSSRRRGMTLVEVLITLALMTLVTGTAVMGFGQLRRARLRQSAVMVASAMRVAYGHASAIGKPVRLVFDFSQRMVMLEEGSGRALVAKPKKDVKSFELHGFDDEAEEKPPPPPFTPTKAFGFDPGKDKPGKELADGIRFMSVDVSHLDAPIEGEGQADIRFWPGGQTERASVQLVIGNPAEATDDDFMTVSLSPISGKVTLHKGRVEMKHPRDESEESERDESGY